MLNIALPKGSLEEQTLLLFEQADLPLRRGIRDYSPTIEDTRISKVKILRPQEIPSFVEQGYFDLGVTGWDWVLESGADVVDVTDLDYSKRGRGAVKIVVAVPFDETEIKSAGDIRPDSKVTTEYPNITKNFFEKLGIPIEVFFSYGATEAKVPDFMDVVVDVTETGDTLRRNGLRIIDILMESKTKLIANKESYGDEEKRRAIDDIKTLLLGVLEARGKVLLEMNVHASCLEDVMAILPAMKKPTVSPLHGSDYVAVRTVADKSEVNVLIPELKAAGVEDILEIDISKIIY